MSRDEALAEESNDVAIVSMDGVKQDDVAIVSSDGVKQGLAEKEQIIEQSQKLAIVIMSANDKVINTTYSREAKDKLESMVMACKMLESSLENESDTKKASDELVAITTTWSMIEPLVVCMGATMTHLKAEILDTISDAAAAAEVSHRSTGSSTILPPPPGEPCMVFCAMCCQ